MTKVTDTLTQKDFHGAFQKFFERYNMCIAAGGYILRRGLKKSLETYCVLLVCSKMLMKMSSLVKFGYVVKRHIKPCCLFKARSLVGWLFGWFDLWHINHCRLFNTKSSLYIYTFIKYMICKQILLRAFLNEHELIFCRQLYGFMYFYQIHIILLIINHLFA